MAAHTLILLRHAKSDWSGNEVDFDRPLAPRGRRQAPEAGRWLAEHVARIDRAIVSPAQRARATWDLVAAELAEPPETHPEPQVYDASGDQLLDIVRSVDETVGTVVLVGHNPGLEDLAHRLVGQVRMPTSALAVIGVEGTWSGTGEAPATLIAAGRPPA